MGISKAEILGPNPRIFSHKMFISIGNFETYGFDLKNKIDKIQINNSPAKLIGNSDITGTLLFEKIPENKKIPITVSLEVESKTITKKIADIDLIDTVDIR